VRALAWLACLFCGAAYLHAQSTLPTSMTPTTIQPASTSLSSPRRGGQGASSAGIDAMVSAEISATVKAAVPAAVNLCVNALSPAAGSNSQGKSPGAGEASQLNAAISPRSSLVADKSWLLRQARQKAGTKAATMRVAARTAKKESYDSASATLPVPTNDQSSNDQSSSVGGSSAGAAGGSAREGEFPDSTHGTGWPSPPEGATALNFSVGGFEAQEPGGFMEETHLQPSLMNVTRDEVRAEGRALRLRRMQEGQHGQASGLHRLGMANLTRSLEARPQFSNTQLGDPTVDLQTSYPK
jgi:hypothetical protein